MAEPIQQPPLRLNSADNPKSVTEKEFVAFMDRLLNGTGNRDLVVEIPKTPDGKKGGNLVANDKPLETIGQQELEAFEALRSTLVSDKTGIANSFYSDLKEARENGRGYGPLLEDWKEAFAREAQSNGSLEAGVPTPARNTSQAPVTVEQILKTAENSRAGFVIGLGGMSPEQQEFTKNYVQAISERYLEGLKGTVRSGRRGEEPTLSIGSGLYQPSKDELQVYMRQFPPSEFAKTQQRERSEVDNRMGLPADVLQELASIRDNAYVSAGYPVSLSDVRSQNVGSAGRSEPSRRG